MSEGNELVEGLRIFEEEEEVEPPDRWRGELARGDRATRTHITYAYAHAHSTDTCPAAAGRRSPARVRSPHRPECRAAPSVCS
jgi:hypothetical protein